MITSTVAVVLPCLDGSLALPRVLAGLPAGYLAVVVDNGSRGGSAVIAARCGALVVHESRKGYGTAVHTGLSARSADIVAVMDCDATMAAADLTELVAAVSEGRSDLVCGRRRAATAAVWPRHARRGNSLLAWVLRRRTDLPLHDLATVRVARRSRPLELGGPDRRSGYPVETLMRAGRAGWRITEHDFPYHPRAEGSRSKVTGSPRGTTVALEDILSVIASTRPSRQASPVAS